MFHPLAGTIGQEPIISRGEICKSMTREVIIEMLLSIISEEEYPIKVYL